MVDPARGSGAAAQQEDDEQDGNRHAQGPQQDVAHLPFLLASPLLKLLHASLQKVDVYRQQSPCRCRLAYVGISTTTPICTRVRWRRRTSMTSVMRREERS